MGHSQYIKKYWFNYKPNPNNIDISNINDYINGLKQNIILTINKNGYPCFCHIYIDMQSVNTKIYGVKEPSLILHSSKN